jgi:dTDP-4-dehydrorhamnose reductase
LNKRILFTGGSGLLALNCAIHLRNDYDIYLGLHSRVISLDGVKTCKLNLENEEELELLLKKLKPDILVNTAGMTNVEECELNPEEAFKINSIVPGRLAKMSKKLGIYFIHISTDHLFDGTKSFVTELEPTCPLNIYGKSKELGDKEVLNNNNDALIVRTNFFGWGTIYRKSFSDTIINTLRANKKITLFDDIFYTPIIIKELVEFLKLLIIDNQSGIFNLTNSERITKYDFGLILAEKFLLNKDLILRGSINDIKNLVKRPNDMSLSNKEILSITKYELLAIEYQIDILKKQEFDGVAFELNQLKIKDN